MNIIFGDVAQHLASTYIILELDTFRLPDRQQTVTAWCLVEKPGLEEIINLEPYKKLHADVVKYYKQRQWQYCNEAIQRLMGKWGGEVDSFYQDLLDRVNQYAQCEPDQDWDGIRLKTD